MERSRKPEAIVGPKRAQGWSWRAVPMALGRNAGLFDRALARADVENVAVEACRGEFCAVEAAGIRVELGAQDEALVDPDF
jgi:hypothetical protein